ncbi:MAG: hypothetical protein ACRYG7_35785 [Janthinobacterium lividum]
MKISHQLLHLSACIGLLGLSQSAYAQSAPTREDSLKGRLWTATARRIWTDTKPPQAQPTAWPTVEAFETWRTATPTDKSELGLLWGDVVKSFGAGAKGTPEQVAQAIVAQATKRQQSKKGRLTRLKVANLKTDLAALTQAKSVTGRALALASDSASPKPMAPAGAPAAVTEEVHPQPDGQVAPASTPSYTLTPPEPHYFGLSPTLAGLALLLLGGLAGAGLARVLRPSSRHRHRHHTAAPAELDSSAIMNSPEYRKLQKQNQTLNTQLHRIQQQLADLQARLPGASASAPTPPPAVEVPLVAEEAPVEELVGAAPAPALPSATRYGPVQEAPFVEERKIVDSPLPQLALMLTVNPRNPDQATFTLNPQVDQARLIGDGLTRLQKFFDYDPPIGGRISSVTAIKPGRLQRHDSGWQVVERARLAIS